MTTFWLITQYLLVISLTISAVMFLVAMFHPLRFDVKLRASIKGQRAEVWFVYLFRIFKIGVIATPHTQDIVLKLFFWKKVLERQQRTRPVAPPKSEPATVNEKTESAKHEAVEKPETVQQNIDTKPAEKPAESEIIAKSETAEKAVTDEPADSSSVQDKTADYPETEQINQINTYEQPETTVIAESEDKSAVNQPETAEAEIIPPPVKPVDTAPLKPLAEVETIDSPKVEKPAEKTAGFAEKESSKDTGSLRQKLRKFKHDFSRRFRQIQGYARVFRQKWRMLFPVFKRFWNRGKKGFGLIDPAVKLRYALHEPYLTGMMQANMAVFSGFAGRFGINFVPVPVFTEPGIYSRGCVSAVIRPWRLVVATIGLVFEKQIYKELWQAFQWYRQRQKK